jgi:hypothetical protein
MRVLYRATLGTGHEAPVAPFEGEMSSRYFVRLLAGPRVRGAGGQAVTRDAPGFPSVLTHVRHLCV